MQKFIEKYSHYQHLWEEQKKKVWAEGDGLWSGYNKASVYPSGSPEVGVALLE